MTKIRTSYLHVVEFTTLLSTSFFIRQIIVGFYYDDSFEGRIQRKGKALSVISRCF